MGGKLFQLIDAGLDLISIHTPFDHSSIGLSEALAQRLELQSTRVLKPVHDAKLLRLVVFVPQEVESELVTALHEVGLGSVGNYSEGYYRVESEGFFTPDDSASPASGESGNREATEESRLEFTLSPDLKERAISTLREVHPYEEPAYSIEETERLNPEVGLGRVGSTTRPLDLDGVVGLVSESLEVPREEIRITGDLERRINRLAVSPGSGGAATRPTLNSPAPVLITGELDYHERLDAYEEGLVVLELGHFHSEKIFVPHLTELFDEEFSRSDLVIYQYMEGTPGE